MTKLSNETELTALTLDAAAAVDAGLHGPDDVFDHAEVLRRLQAANAALPPIYQGAVGEPLYETFDRIGPEGWADVLGRDPELSGIGLLGLDLFQAVAQRGEGYLMAETEAFQEVVSDLYDGFLSAGDRVGVRPPEHGVAPPLVKWGRPFAGPYAWTAPATRLYGCGAGVVSMSTAFAASGLAAWGAVGHETAGHHVLHADEGLREALAKAVRDKLRKATKGFSDDKKESDDLRAFLTDYWSERIDESASDVLGVVNMGPAAAIALIAYFRSLSLVAGGQARLSPVGSASAVHPAPLARGLLMASAVGACSFQGSKKWRSLIEQEVEADRPDDGALFLAGRKVPVAAVAASADCVVTAILTHKTEELEGKSLIEIQDWREHDQQIVEALTLSAVLADEAPPTELQGGLYAAHAVAAAIMGALVTGRPNEAQARMIEMIQSMHRRNPSWSALFAMHPGDVLVASNPNPFFAKRRRKKDKGGEGGGGSGGTDGGFIPVLASGTDGGWITVPLGGSDGGAITVPLAEGEEGRHAVSLVGPNWPRAGRRVVRAVLGVDRLSEFRLRKGGLKIEKRARRRSYVNLEAEAGGVVRRTSEAMLELILGEPD